jgi:curved DNA-binding protein CbpA
LALTDYFALLGEPRRPWLDPERVKARFLELAPGVHPDRVHEAGDSERARQSEEFSRLNSAQQCLRETVSRLRHLIELESGSPPGDVKTVPPSSVGLVMKVAKKCREADGFIDEKRRITSPILKARVFAKSAAWVDELTGLLQEGQRAEAALEERIGALNPAWEAAPPPSDPGRSAALPMAEVEELYRAASFLARSRQQLRARIGLLAE